MRPHFVAFLLVLAGASLVVSGLFNLIASPTVAEFTLRTIGEGNATVEFEEGRIYTVWLVAEIPYEVGPNSITVEIYRALDPSWKWRGTTSAYYDSDDGDSSGQFLVGSITAPREGTSVLHWTIAGNSLVRTAPHLSVIRSYIGIELSIGLILVGFVAFPLTAIVFTNLASRRGAEGGPSPISTGTEPALSSPTPPSGQEVIGSPAADDSRGLPSTPPAAPPPHQTAPAGPDEVIH